ncbi:hypothetical protein [Rhodovulum sulfidophilum]|uniref:hypothetical protein n=1 Tax=Rhodovulum sulfidophilum TaxID=35806 RepID=UPI001389EB59|nr:hypothetical protein [Rhodovulum sulfidophilum]NDK35488.1 hypothetical protein [Rhodovulum sulfidophilum]
MSTKIVSAIQPQQKKALSEHIIYAALEPLETALAEDDKFMDNFHSSNFDLPDSEPITLGSIAHWLLFETERSGDPTAAFTKLNEYLGSPRPTWQHTVVCTDVFSQGKGNFEPWRFSNGIVAYATGLSPEYKVLSDENLYYRCLIFLDQEKVRNYDDFIERVTDCCRSLSFFSGEGCYLRPSYHTYTFDTSAPFPLGSSKGWLSTRKNNVPGLLTADTFEEADTFLKQLREIKPGDLDVVRRVLDRHAGAAVWGDLENRAIEARVCMEMILMRNSMGDNAFKVSRRAAYLMNDDSRERLELMKRAKLLYDAGSKAVHGGSLTGSKQKDLDLTAAVRGCHEFLHSLVSAWISRKAQELDDNNWALVEMGGEFPTQD